MSPIHPSSFRHPSIISSNPGLAALPKLLSQVIIVVAVAIATSTTCAERSTLVGANANTATAAVTVAWCCGWTHHHHHHYQNRNHDRSAQRRRWRRQPKHQQQQQQQRRRDLHWKTATTSSEIAVAGSTSTSNARASCQTFINTAGTTYPATAHLISSSSAAAAAEASSSSHSQDNSSSSCSSSRSRSRSRYETMVGYSVREFFLPERHHTMVVPSSWSERTFLPMHWVWGRPPSPPIAPFQTEQQHDEGKVFKKDRICSNPLDTADHVIHNDGTTQKLDRSTSNTTTTTTQHHSGLLVCSSLPDHDRLQRVLPKKTLQILYCDADVCVVYKPPGVLSVPGRHRYPSLADLVYRYVKQGIIGTSRIDDDDNDSNKSRKDKDKNLITTTSATAALLNQQQRQLDQMIVHRLDMDTSGILVYALTTTALNRLHAAFAGRHHRRFHHQRQHPGGRGRSRSHHHQGGSRGSNNNNDNQDDDNVDMDVNIEKPNDSSTKQIHKTYVALLCGHLGRQRHHRGSSLSSSSSSLPSFQSPASPLDTAAFYDHSTSSLPLWYSGTPSSGLDIEIDLALERDPAHMSVIRVAQTPTPINNNSNNNTQTTTTTKTTASPKPSFTELSVLAWEYRMVPLLGTEAYAAVDSEEERMLPIQQKQQIIPSPSSQLRNSSTSNSSSNSRHRPCYVPVTRVRLTPHTGRTHQLRVHCAALGYPIVGDTMYGWRNNTIQQQQQQQQRKQQQEQEQQQHQDRSNCSHQPLQHYTNDDDNDIDMMKEAELRNLYQLFGSNLCLHAQRLTLRHPISGAPMMFECDPPF